MRHAIILALALAAAAPAAAGALSGAEAKAVAAVLPDFEARLTRDAAARADLRPWTKALEAVENYAVTVRRDGTDWLVRFAPSLKSPRGGRRAEGGGEYRVSAGDYRVLSYAPSK
jgi:hypothetical protein